MGILVNTGFDVGSSNPVDSRTVKNTTDERDELVSEGKVYENLKVYCKDTQKEYRWTGTEWEEVGSGYAKTYTSLTELGLTADASFQDVVDALPKGDSALLGVKDFTNYQTIFPYEESNDQFARVHIVKGVADGSCMYARWFRKDGSKEAIAIFNINDNTFSEWKKLYTDETRVTTLETQVNELFQNAPNLATKEYVDSKLGKESINDSITSTTDVWSSSKTKSYVDAASNKPVTTIAGGNKSVDTGWNLKCGTKYDFGKVLLINAYNDGYSGTTGTGSCLLFVMGDFNTAKITTTTICKTGIDISRLYSLEVSSSGTLVIKTTNELATSNNGKGKAKLSFVFLN